MKNQLPISNRSSQLICFIFSKIIVIERYFGIAIPIFFLLFTFKHLTNNDDSTTIIFFSSIFLHHETIFVINVTINRYNMTSALITLNYPRELHFYTILLSFSLQSVYFTLFIYAHIQIPFAWKKCKITKERK